MRLTRLMIPVLLIVGVVLLVLGLRGRDGGAAAKRQQEAVKPQTTDMVVAKRAVPVGTRVALADLDRKPMTQDQIARDMPADAIQDEKQIVGGTAKVNLAAGDFFTTGNLDPVPASASQKVQPGYVAVTIPAPPKPSLYDLKFLNPDDRVDVFGVNQDLEAGQTISVRLATNVRVLAVDWVISKEVEEKRRADLDKEIAKLQQEKMAKMNSQPPASTDVIKGFDDQIKAKQDEKDPKIENPSVTVEVTPAQAQSVLLWRKTADLMVALHRVEDAQEVIFDNAAAYLMGAPGEGGRATPGAAGLVTLDDVVPLDRRDPEKYMERQRRIQDERMAVAEKDVEAVERRVRVAELQVELRNLSRYGSRTAPAVPPPATTPAPPAPATVVMPAGGSTAQLTALQAEVRRLRGDVARQQSGGGAAQQKAGRGTIEVYRGKEKTVVNY